MDTENMTDKGAYWTGHEDGQEMGFITAILLSRYFALRHHPNDAFYRAPIPERIPAVVEYLSKKADALRYRWNDLDECLECDTVEELERLEALKEAMESDWAAMAGWAHPGT